MECKGVFFQGRRTAISVVVFVFTLIIPQLPAHAVNVTVQWDPSPDTNVVGYNFYYGSASRTYTNIINVGNATSVTVSNLPGLTYYFAATAYNGLGTESVFSEELPYNAASGPRLVMASPRIVRWQGLSNVTYRVQTKTNLLSAVWQPLGTATSTSTSYSYTNSNALGAQRYYRVVYP